MRIHIIRSQEYEANSFWEVMDLLKQFKGPMEFVTAEEPIDIGNDHDWHEFTEDEFGKAHVLHEEMAMIPKHVGRVTDVHFPFTSKILTWEHIWELINEWVKSNDIGNDEAVILLTAHMNEHNWFSSWNIKNNYHFVHTDFWEYFIDNDHKYPVTYEIMSSLLQREMFGDFDKLKKWAHEEPRGCMNDLCLEKKQISLKLRTADICSDCITVIREKGVSQAMVTQVTDAFELIRKQLIFKERFRQNMTPSRLEVRGRNKDIFLVDMEDHHLHLGPLEKTVFLFFLQHPEGVSFPHLIDSKEELYNLYESVSNLGTIAEIHNTVDRLLDVTNNLLSEKVARIKRTFKNAVGDKMAEHYIISGRRGEPKVISLDRGLVEFDA